MTFEHAGSLNIVTKVYSYRKHSDGLVLLSGATNWGIWFTFIYSQPWHCLNFKQLLNFYYSSPSFRAFQLPCRFPDFVFHSPDFVLYCWKFGWAIGKPSFSNDYALLNNHHNIHTLDLVLLLLFVCIEVISLLCTQVGALRLIGQFDAGCSCHQDDELVLEDVKNTKYFWVESSTRERAWSRVSTKTANVFSMARNANLRFQTGLLTQMKINLDYQLWPKSSSSNTLYCKTLIDNYMRNTKAPHAKIFQRQAPTLKWAAVLCATLLFFAICFWKFYYSTLKRWQPKNALPVLI